MSDHIVNQIRAIADWLDGENPFVLGSGATIPFPEASEKAAELRRIAETLEAGVVVVPVELLRSIRYLLGKVAEQDALTSYDRRTAKELAGELGNVLHHPRQNVAGGGVSDARVGLAAARCAGS